MVLLEYYNLLSIFSKYNSNILAPYCYYDYKIELMGDSRLENLSFTPLYKLLLEELEECWKYITRAL